MRPIFICEVGEVYVDLVATMERGAESLDIAIDMVREEGYRVMTNSDGGYCDEGDVVKGDGTAIPVFYVSVYPG